MAGIYRTMQDPPAKSARKRRVRFNYPANFKRQVLSSLDKASAQDAAKSCGIPLSTLYRWRKDSNYLPGQDKQLHESKIEASRLHAPIESDTRPAPAIPLNRHGHYRFERNRARRSRKVLDRLLLAYEVVENRYFEHIDCDALAEMAAMSKCHFVRVYKQAFGESPYQHLIRRRVGAALSLLGVTLQPTLAIACAVGFESGSSLTKAIKKFSTSGIPQLVY